MVEKKPVKVLGLCGSLRKGSFNKMALNAAIELAPSSMTIETFDLSPIPLYNDDVRLAGLPEPVQALCDAVRAADAVLFVSPEYNYSMSGVLKNAIDWVSRVPQQPFDGKPCAMMGASMGLFGTARAQYHLRQTCVFVNLLPVNKPEVMIAQAQNKFDANGKLTDETTRGFIRDLMAALEAWTRKLRGD